MTAAVPTVAALRAHLLGLDVVKLIDLACNTNAPEGVQEHIGEALGCRLEALLRDDYRESLAMLARLNEHPGGVYRFSASALLRLAGRASTPAPLLRPLAAALSARLTIEGLAGVIERPDLLPRFRDELTGLYRARTRREGVSWDRQRLQRRAAGEPVALIGGRPSTMLWYAGEQISIRSLERLYRDTEEVLAALRGDG